MVAPRAQSRGLELICSLDPALPPLVRGDPQRLRQVVTNLLSNALKFTQQGEVTLQTTAKLLTEGQLELTVEVRDTGIGIAPEHQERVFESFVQEDSSTTRRFGGTGLGLTISRNLVSRMGGQIHLESRPGQGSRFWFTCPLAPAESAPLPPPPPQLRGARILVVDDHPSSLQAIGRYLAALRCQYATASSGREALALLRAAHATGVPFRAALIDLHMPGLDGLETAELIRSDPSLSSTILIAMALVDGHAFTARESALHFAARVTKPLRAQLLKEALVAALAPPAPQVPPPALEAANALNSALSAPPRGARVLVADDNPVNRMLVQRALEKAGYFSEAVADGQQAVEAAAHGAFDLILMDLHMPQMTGIEATRQIRNLAGAVSRTPIVALTAAVLEEDQQNCLAAGMNGFLRKPVALAELRAAVDHWAAPADPATTSL